MIEVGTWLLERGCLLTTNRLTCNVLPCYLWPAEKGHHTHAHSHTRLRLLFRRLPTHGWMLIGWKIWLLESLIIQKPHFRWRAKRFFSPPQNKRYSINRVINLLILFECVITLCENLANAFVSKRRTYVHRLCLIIRLWKLEFANRLYKWKKKERETIKFDYNGLFRAFSRSQSSPISTEDWHLYR